MGTEYILFKTKDENKNISLYEMSNRFDFDIENLLEDKELTISDLSTNQLLKIALKIIQVCSYFMETDILKEEINQFIDKNIY